MDSMRENNDGRLDRVFQAYRQACPDPEVSANFMPNLWQKIDARQRVAFSFSRMASAFVTAALALSLALGVYLSVPSNSSYYSQSYVEALSSEPAPDNADFIEPVRLEVQ